MGVIRPKTVSVAILGVFGITLISQAVIFSHAASPSPTEIALSVVNIVVTAAGLLILLNLPFRHPGLPNDGISKTSASPSSTVRTPEDNLTLWQFMSVSWMVPMISEGQKRQLNDEDVWSLGYEFQHVTLHERFRETKGSVLRRILEANGADLFLIALYGIIEMLGNASGPVLLQQLLRSLEDPSAPKRAAITYAVLASVSRVIVSQLGIINLWFSRRAYERCRGELITMLSEKSLSRKMIGQTNDSKAGTEEESASMGKIMNLIRFDAYEVAQRFWEFEIWITVPLEIIVSILLIWQIIGWSALIGVVTVFVAQILNALIARVLVKWETVRRTVTDEKLQKISQFVEAIRHLRWYAWQNVWLGDILESRQKELRLRVITGMLNSLVGTVNILTSGIFPVAAFYAYTVWAGQRLRVDVAFPALALFMMLEQNLRQLPQIIRVLLNAAVALRRIQNFMNEPDREEASSSSASEAGSINMGGACFAWPGAADAVLNDITINISSGFTIIYGEVAAGKTALLQAIVGELDQLDGDFERPTDTIGYCAQTPWLQSMSIKDNILFSSPFEPQRYDDVLEACALKPDLINFSDGDLTQIGENGTGLSGGQKARVALARAVYSHAPILLLDDPISALDQQTAESIVRKCFAGPLVQGRTVLLVTHRTDLCLHLAAKVIEMSHGRARVLDAQSSLLKELSRTDSAGEAKQRDELKTTVAEPISFMDEEYRAHGGVKASVYWEYVKAAKLRWWAIMLVVLAVVRVVDVANTWFLKDWGEAYGRTTNTAIIHNAHQFLQQSIDNSRFVIQQLPSIKDPFSRLPSPEDNVKPWLLGFLILAVARAVFFAILQLFMLVIVYTAGKKMFAEVMARISQATFRYYDVTPVGRLMNRLDW